MAEIWKSLPETPIYEVSNLGNVRSLTRKMPFKGGLWGSTERTYWGRTLSPGKSRHDGYAYVHLSIPGSKSKNFYVHRLVAAAFVAGDRALTVNHIDGDKSNNCASNLEWVSQRQNNVHAIEVLKRKPARQRPVRVNGVQFDNQTLAAKSLGVTASQISKAARRGHLCHGLRVEHV